MCNRPFRNALLALAAGLALPLLAPLPAARAQDGTRPPEARDGAPVAVDAARAAALLEQLDALYTRVAERPAPVDLALLGDPDAAGKERARFAKEMAAWKAGLARLPELALDHREAAGDAAAPRSWFYSGFARVRRADTVGRAESQELLQTGADDLRFYLERAPRDAAHRVDAQHQLAYALLRAAGGDGDAVVAAVPDVDTAVRARLQEGRAAEAGSLAFLALKALVAAGREAEAAALATGWDAASADFGPSTGTVRALVRRARVRPGAPMPELPELPSYTGAPMPWAELAGKPYVLHFFSTTVSDTPREIETVLVPLRDELGAKGLRLVGCSTDRALSDAEIAKERAYREEVSRPEPVQDGRQASVRAWAEARGVDWPWYWDGKWMSNVLAQHLGVEVNAPFAILVDDKGVIRWRGQPFQGLAEAARELLQ